MRLYSNVEQCCCWRLRTNKAIARIRTRGARNFCSVQIYKLVVFLRLAAVGTWRNFRRACYAECLELRTGNRELRFGWMICVCQQLSVQSKRADGGRILVTRAMRYKRFVFNAQCEFAFATRFPHVEGILANQCLHLETAVLNNHCITHLAPLMIVTETIARRDFIRRVVATHSRNKSLAVSCGKLPADPLPDSGVSRCPASAGLSATITGLMRTRMLYLQRAAQHLETVHFIESFFRSLGRIEFYKSESP